MASNKIKGLTVEIGGETTELTAALKDVDKASKASSDELKEIERLLKMDPKSAELLSQKMTVLGESVSKAREKLQILQDAEKSAREQFERGEIGGDQLRALQRETVYAENKLKKLELQYDDVKNSAKDGGKAIKDSGEAAKEAKKGADDLSKSLDVLKDKYDDAKNSAKDTAADLGKGLAAAGAAVVAGTSAAMGYEDAMAAIQIQTGTSAEEMAGYKSAVDGVFASGLGEDLADIASTMATIAQQTGETDPGKLEELARNALVLKDGFGFETAEQMRAVQMMVDQFGISAAEAYDLIVTGAQNGLNKNGDLLDVINEYSVHYKNLGYDAKGFFNSLTAGASTGVFSVDKLGDAMKEFGIRIKDSGAATVEALNGLGYGETAVAELQAAFAAGGEKASESMRTVLNSLWAIQDPLKQNEIGVALFGTMWEDMGAEAIQALTSTEDVLGDVSGAMDAVNEISMETTSRKWEQLGRTVQQDMILPLGEELLPAAQAFFGYCVDNADSLIPKVKALAAILATIWAVNKVSKFTRSIRSLVSAYKALKTAMTAANAAQASSGWGALLMVIGLVAGEIYSYISAQNDAKQAAEEQARAAVEAYQEELQAIEDLEDALYDEADARRDTARAVSDEYDSYQDLWDELQKLVDADGNVLEGQEKRVDFIRNTLSDALGEEILLIDGQIAKYSELQGAIDGVILRQRTESLLSSGQGAYEDAKADLPTLKNEYETKNLAYNEWLQLGGDLSESESQLAALEAVYLTLARGMPKREDYATDAEGYMAYEDALESWKTVDTQYAKAIAAQKNSISAMQQEYQTSTAEAEWLLAQAKLNQAEATVYCYEALEEAFLTGDQSAMTAAIQMFSDGLMTRESGATTATLHSQFESLTERYTTRVTQAAQPGSLISEEELATELELLLTAFFEAYSAAYAEADEERMNVLRNMLGQSFGDNKTAASLIESGYVASAEDFIAALSMGSSGGTLKNEQPPASGGTQVYRSQAQPLAAGFIRQQQISQKTQESALQIQEDVAAKTGLSVLNTERMVEHSRYLNDMMSGAPLVTGETMEVKDLQTEVSGKILQKILKAVQDMDLTLVLNDGTLIAKTVNKTDAALGKVAASGARGTLKE